MLATSALAAGGSGSTCADAFKDADSTLMTHAQRLAMNSSLSLRKIVSCGTRRLPGESREGDPALRWHPTFRLTQQPISSAGEMSNDGLYGTLEEPCVSALEPLIATQAGAMGKRPSCLLLDGMQPLKGNWNEEIAQRIHRLHGRSLPGCSTCLEHIAPRPYLPGDRSRHTTASARGGSPVTARRATAGPGLCSATARAPRLRLMRHVLQEMRSSWHRTLRL